MKWSHLLGVLVLGLLALLSQSSFVAADSNSGGCAACTLVVGLVEQIAMVKNVDISSAVKNICTNLAPSNSQLSGLCALALSGWLPAMNKDFAAGYSPDYTCKYSLGMCKEFSCNLFKTWPPKHITDLKNPLSRKLLSLDDSREIFEEMGKILGLNVQLPVVDHKPLVDLDGDLYSTMAKLRGSDWRGKDCNDSNANVYPGRAIDTVGPKQDHNCNGIKGVAVDGQSYEEKFCAKSQQRGVLILGDSATAHFSLPPTWMTAATMNNQTFTNLLPVLTNEADYPMCSWATGHTNDTAQCPESKLPMTSIYLKLRERNLCNHRDFQNIGVNGASTKNMQPPNGVIVSMHNRNVTDQPSLMFYALIGNDVCNRRHNFDSMTTPAEFEANTLNSLRYLDERVAPGSHLTFVGLVDGRVLYESMYDQIHPIGTTYADFYDFLNCLETSPCWGWMNSDESVRNKTTERAMQLNDVYTKIIKEHKFKNFDMDYVFADMKEAIAGWVAQGGHPADLIEKTDGFHPSQTANSILAEKIWQYLETTHPDWLGPVNPNNAAIQALFGDQGGH